MKQGWEERRDRRERRGSASIPREVSSDFSAVVAPVHLDRLKRTQQIIEKKLRTLVMFPRSDRPTADVHSLLTACLLVHTN